MKATYIIKKDDGGYHMDRNIKGVILEPKLGKREILADFIVRLVSTIEQMRDGDTVTMRFEAKIK